MNPNLVAAVRKRRGLDHQGLPLESTTPYGGLSEADINATGPLEGPEQPPPELPTPAPHEVAAAQQALDEAPRPGSIPAQVGQAVMAAAPVDNDAKEMAAAQEADRQSYNDGLFELAAKQFVSGVTQTPQAGVSQAGPAQVPQAQARAKSRREQVADELMRRRQGAQDERQARLDTEGREDKTLDRNARLAAALEERKNREARDAEAKRRFEVSHGDSQAIAKSNNAIAQASLGLRAQGEKRDAEKFESDKTEKAAKLIEDVPPGYEIAEEARPSAESRKKFAALVGSSEKMKGLTAQMRKAIAGTTGVSRTLDPKVVTGLQQLATQVQIEAKNVAGLGALSGPDMGLMNRLAADPTSVITNLTVDLPKMLDQLDAWGSTQVAGESKATGIRKKASADAATTKTVGGKTYKKVPGGWDPVN